MSKNTIRIAYESHSNSHPRVLRFSGADVSKYSGVKSTVYIDVSELDSEDRINLGKALGDWCGRLVQDGLAELADEAQMALFTAHRGELNRFAPRGD